jgi:FtsH-binding integral membrane protein
LFAQEEPKERVKKLESQVNNLSKYVSQERLQHSFHLDELRKKQERTTWGLLTLYLFLTGAFCALWAQNTGRSAWQWFFLGLIFHLIAVLVLLAKNADAGRQAEGKPPANKIPAVIAVVVAIVLYSTVMLLLGYPSTHRTSSPSM